MLPEDDKCVKQKLFRCCEQKCQNAIDALRNRDAESFQNLFPYLFLSNKFNTPVAHTGLKRTVWLLQDWNRKCKI